MTSDVSINAISPIHRCWVKFLLINCKFPMTPKSHMLHGVNDPYMVICNQSAKFHERTLSRLLGYNLDIMRQSACLVVNPITVYSYGFLFNCTTVGRASDSMTALT